MSKYWKILGWIAILFCSNHMCAHPTGNIIVVGNLVLWPYVSPIGDRHHRACVMVWDGKSKPKQLIRSEFPASDFTLFAKGEDIYLIESRYINTKDIFETRILKTKLDLSPPQTIWPWFEDKWKIGNNGIVMNSDYHLLFVHYPYVYEMKKGSKANIYFPFPDRIQRIRQVEENKLLLLSEQNCWLSNHQGEVQQSWQHLIDTKVKKAPLGRNTIYDMDYKGGELLVAYWGKGSFELIDS